MSAGTSATPSSVSTTTRLLSEGLDLDLGVNLKHAERGLGWFHGWNESCVVASSRRFIGMHHMCIYIIVVV
jgi:hypothetical protein